MKAENRLQKAAPKRGRRKFLQQSGIVLGSGLILVSLGIKPGRRTLATFLETGDQFSMLTSKKIDQWFELSGSNQIILKSAKAEMGQGIFTGFAMIAAEELNTDPDNISVISHNTRSDVNDILGTNGSSSTLVMFEPLREIAALFRETFTHTAANHWDCKPEDVENKDLHLKYDGKSMSYQELDSIITKWIIPSKPELKSQDSFQYIGKDRKRTDLKPKINGTAVYAIDHHIEGMVYAQFIKCPKLDGRIKSVNAEGLIDIPGFIDFVSGDDYHAIIAENHYALRESKKRLLIEYETGKKWDHEEVIRMAESPQVKPVQVQKKGNRNWLKNNSGPFIQASYNTPIGVHGQIEPNGFVIHLHDDIAEIFIGYQWTYYLQYQVAKTLDIKKKDVHVQNHFIGGGFGRKFFHADVVNGALLARKTGRPICVVWDREDEFLHGYVRPHSHHNLKAKLDAELNIYGLEHRLTMADMIFNYLPFPILNNMLGTDMLGSGHGARILYNIPHRTAYHYEIEVPYRSGIWRSVGMFANNFAIESFIDELAFHASADPADFRLGHLKSKKNTFIRLREALEVLLEKSDWHRIRKEEKGWGIAVGEDRNSVSAAAIKVHLADDKIIVDKIIQVIDPGLIINPDGVRMQVEGGSIMAMSAALWEEIIIEDNQFNANNFDRYRIAIMEDAPDIEVHLKQGLDKPYGVGEIPLAAIAPAIANAVFDLTGIRLRDIPLQKTYSATIKKG